jgi:hypothetical protein
MSRWYIYAVAEIDHQGNKTGFWKVGHAKDPMSRARQLSTGNPRLLLVAVQRPALSKRVAHEIERLVHVLCPGRQGDTEWFLTSQLEIERAILAAVEAHADEQRASDFSFTRDIYEASLHG